MTPGQGIALAAGVLLILVVIRSLWEPRQIRVTRQRFFGKTYEAAANQKTEPTLKILFLSDLHQDKLKIKPSKIFAAVKNLNPDIILFGGDLSAHTAFVSSAIDLLSRINEWVGGTQIPIVAVPGNHDTTESIARMRQAGFTVLQNDSFVFSCRGETFLIIGLDDPSKNQPDPIEAFKKVDLEQIPADRRLLLTHNPDHVLLVPPGQIKWFFAGHFHGGQIYMPFRLEFRLLRRERAPSLCFYRGPVEWHDMTGYLTRGLGCVVIPIRLRSLPEIALIDLFLPPL